MSELGIKTRFVQDNESLSEKGVIRGMHYQKGTFAQAKLVRVVEGEVLDVALDIRADSPTFGRYVSVILSEANHKQLFIPRGFAHGFAVLSERAKFLYKCDNYYSPDHEGAINIADAELKIDWMIDEKDRILSSKDLRAPSFAQYAAAPDFTMEDFK